MPELGAFMVTKTDSWFGWAIRKVTHSPVNHAAVYVGRGLIVEAQPRGAKVSRVSTYPKAIWSTRKMALTTRLTIIEKTLDLVGTPYNFLDIAAQAMVRLFHWHAPKWALRRISSDERLQCAQLVDVAYTRAGVALFADGRPDGLVAPADLYELIHDAA